MVVTIINMDSEWTWHDEVMASLYMNTSTLKVPTEQAIKKGIMNAPDRQRAK